MNADDIWGRLFNFANYGELVALVQNSIVAAAVLGIVGGLIGLFVMQRDMAFAVHGISELSFAGAAAALLIGVDLGPNLSVTGSLATMLWLVALRREGENVSALQFFKLGVLVMPPALIAALLLL